MEITVSKNDREILRELAGRIAEIAQLPVQKETIKEWKLLNGLKNSKALIWINEIPWHEMNVDDELTLQTSTEFLQKAEQTLRRTIYLWEHMRADMVVEPKFYSDLVINDSGFGIDELVQVVSQDLKSDIVSREFTPQIQNEKDLEKIKTPIISLDKEASERNFQIFNDIFGDILTVEKRGVVHKWFSPWDELIRWWGVEPAMLDLIMRPELVHQAMERLVNAYIARLEQWENLNVLSLTEGNYRVGSGGLGYSDELPKENFDPNRVRTIDQWGCGTAQIFSDVSPEMHKEFALQYELKWMERFGLNYYGCCEPLHVKMDIIKSIPNLRKISMSPWADVDEMVKKTEARFVLSHKPNPAIFSGNNWNADFARKQIEEVLEKTKGCVVEIIMKDISTVSYKAQNLWEWAKIAKEVTHKFAHS